MASPGDYLRKVQPGEVLSSIPRDAYNAFVDAALANRGTGQTGAGNGADYSRRLDLVTVKNTTAAAVDLFGVLELGSPMIAAADFLSEFLRVVNFDGVAPTGPGVNFCILLSPLAQNATGKGVVSGVVPCRITGAAGTKAVRPAAGVTATLAASTSGGARVLWQEAGASERWAYVLLPAEGGAWVTCHKRVTHVYCSGSTVLYNAEYEYLDAFGNVVFVSDNPCVLDLTISGVSNGTCTACSLLNAAHALRYMEANTWALTGGGNVCTGAALGMTLTLAGTTLTLLIKAGATTIATYTNASAGGYTGAAPITVTKVSNDGSCATWPTTITVSAP